MIKKIYLLLLPAFATVSAFSQIMPPAVIGSWSGKVIEHGRSDYYTVNLTLKQGDIGEVVGTVSYPDYNCGGELELVKAERDADEHVALVKERLTFGVQECVDDGNIVIAVVNGRLKFNWLKSGLDYKAEGYLDRQ